MLKIWLKTTFIKWFSIRNSSIAPEGTFGFVSSTEQDKLNCNEIFNKLSDLIIMINNQISQVWILEKLVIIALHSSSFFSSSDFLTLLKGGNNGRSSLTASGSAPALICGGAMKCSSKGPNSSMTFFWRPFFGWSFSFLGLFVVSSGRLRNWLRAGLAGLGLLGFRVVGWFGLLVGPEGRGGSLVGPAGRGSSSS